MDSRLAIRVTLLVGAAVLLSGCFNGAFGGKDKAAAYKGEFKEFDLYLFYLNTGASDCAGWELYPGTRVDAFAWAPENDCHKATVPGPEIRVRQGDTVRVNFYTGGTPMAHTIHWHGLHVPWDQDGVPYVSQLPVGGADFGGTGPGVYTYEFQVNQSGTYWYHCHVDTAHHLDMGMYGPLIVDPADPADDPHYDTEATLIFDEWDKSHTHATNVNQATSSNLVSKSGDPMPTIQDSYGFWRDYLVMNNVYRASIQNGTLKGTPGVAEQRDWYPVTYPAYFPLYDTFLINGRAFPETEPIFVKTGETLRLRLINAGAQVHSIHLHGHHFLVTHTDGYKLASPYYKDTLLIAPGERYDAYLVADNPGPWMVHDHIALNEANDYISPGGMSTMLCYTDGWTFPADAGFKNPCDEMKHAHDLGRSATAGDILKLQTYALAKENGYLPNFVSFSPGVLPAPNGPSGVVSTPTPTDSFSFPAPTTSPPLPSLPLPN